MNGRRKKENREERRTERERNKIYKIYKGVSKHINSTSVNIFHDTKSSKIALAYIMLTFIVSASSKMQNIPDATAGNEIWYM
jgi:hypothetical protein